VKIPESDRDRKTEPGVRVDSGKRRPGETTTTPPPPPPRLVRFHMYSDISRWWRAVDTLLYHFYGREWKPVAETSAYLFAGGGNKTQACAHIQRLSRSCFSRGA